MRERGNQPGFKRVREVQSGQCISRAYRIPFHMERRSYLLSHFPAKIGRNLELAAEMIFKPPSGTKSQLTLLGEKRENQGDKNIRRLECSWRERDFQFCPNSEMLKRSETFSFFSRIVAWLLNSLDDHWRTDHLLSRKADNGEPLSKAVQVPLDSWHFKMSNILA